MPERPATLVHPGERLDHMDTVAVVMREPGAVALSRLGLPEPDEGELTVQVDWSGISTGTERLL